MDAVV